MDNCKKRFYGKNHDEAFAISIQGVCLECCGKVERQERQHMLDLGYAECEECNESADYKCPNCKDYFCQYHFDLYDKCCLDCLVLLFTG